MKYLRIFLLAVVLSACTVRPTGLITVWCHFQIKLDGDTSCLPKHTIPYGYSDSGAAIPYPVH